MARLKNTKTSRRCMIEDRRVIDLETAGGESIEGVESEKAPRSR